MDSTRVAQKQALLRRKRKVGWPKRMFVLRKHKHIRRWLLRNPWMRPMTVFNMAAIKIQSMMRRYLCQKHARYPVIPRSSRKALTGVSKKSGHKQLDTYLNKMEYYSRRPYGKPSWMDGGFSAWCAVRIQAWFRMTRCLRRYNYKNRITNQIAALVIQSAYRNIVFRRMKRKLLINLSAQRNTRSEYDCAVGIQLSWRSYCSKRVYRYFRDLIVKKLHGAPAELLRTVIPNESCLLDRAAGVHVRFRLAGSVFPPKIVFKIFTHRPLCDVNAFAPRNYNQEKELTMYEKFNKSEANANNASHKKGAMRVGTRYFDTVVTSNVPADRWYQREERNHWRPISSQLLFELFTPQWAAHQQQMQLLQRGDRAKAFHYSKLQRKQDILQHKKRRRREWMVKAYLLGNLGTLNPAGRKDAKGDENEFDDENIDDGDGDALDAGNNAAVANLRQKEIVDWVYSMEHMKDQQKLLQQQQKFIGSTAARPMNDFGSFTDSLESLSVNMKIDIVVGGQKKGAQGSSLNGNVGGAAVEKDNSSNEELLKWRLDAKTNLFTCLIVNFCVAQRCIRF
jgi:hypothetical protein